MVGQQSRPACARAAGLERLANPPGRNAAARPLGVLLGALQPDQPAGRASRALRYRLAVGAARGPSVRPSAHRAGNTRQRRTAPRRDDRASNPKAPPVSRSDPASSPRRRPACAGGRRPSSRRAVGRSHSTRGAWRCTSTGGGYAGRWRPASRCRHWAPLGARILSMARAEQPHARPPAQSKLACGRKADKRISPNWRSKAPAAWASATLSVPVIASSTGQPGWSIPGPIAKITGSSRAR